MKNKEWLNRWGRLGPAVLPVVDGGYNVKWAEDLNGDIHFYLTTKKNVRINSSIESEDELIEWIFFEVAGLMNSIDLEWVPKF